MSIPPTRLLIAAAAAACLLSAAASARQDRGPFAPDVQEFVDVYLKHGGDKLTSWVQGDRTSTPDEARRAFEPAAGLAMDLVAAEPVIRQPVDLHFDDRGRLWVVQYLQYPFPAGLTITSYDQYLRAQYDGVPAAPPNHVRGADRITVLEDTDGDGRFEKHTDVITGLNITTSVLTGRSGVWVMNPPYLLFYRDTTGDGLPDGGPDVRLAGFGLEDTHSLANSLTWGPDGWLYGVHGSTSTSRVRGISFLGQAVWRYHPERDRFELFAEGGGNPWTLSFDSKGRAFSGDNGGNSRGFHWVGGGRYEKNWPKHGPFAQPHSFGYFRHMDHQGYAARFAMTSVVYEDGKLPGYEGQLVSGMALTSRMQASRFIREGSTFRTADTDALVTTRDRSFRPVDTAVGPDGAVYVADWCDIRMDHTDPRDTWDKACGRIWRLRAARSGPAGLVNLAGRSTRELVELLADPRKWYRDHARRLLGERADRSIVPHLRELAEHGRGQLALEALWAAHLLSGTDGAWAVRLFDHPDPPVRSWTVRLLDESSMTSPPVHDRLIRLARTETDPEVRSELAHAASRAQGERALAVLEALIAREEDVPDKHIPLRIWWALEKTMTDGMDVVLRWLEKPGIWDAPLFAGHLAGRVARRLAADRGDTHAYRRLDSGANWKAYARHPRTRLPGGTGDYTDWETGYTEEISQRNLSRLARLLELPHARAHRDRLLAGVKAGLEQGVAPARVPDSLRAVIATWWQEGPQDGDLLAVAARLGHPGAAQKARALQAAALAALPEAAAAGAEGRESFLTYCAPCHQTDGSGMARLALPLRGSPLVLGREDVLARIVLNGLKGELLMPPLGTLDDRQLAAILTYVRSAWGHRAGAVSAETIRQARAASRDRSTPWTREELAALTRRE